MFSRPNRSRRFAPYVVEDSGFSVNQVTDTVNKAVFDTYGPDLRTGRDNRPVAAPHGSFLQLLDELMTVDHIRFVDHVELSLQPCPPDVVRVAIRHDIDSDVVAAITQAEAEAERGIRANWVVLHTARYYGKVDPKRKKFMRNDSMGNMYRRLQDLGHEVSIHSDPLGLYQTHGIDGAQGFTTELAWLRSLGLDIRGTTAHNNRLAYGAENFEMFVGFVSSRGVSIPPGTTEIVHEGKYAPLRVLDDAELGLVYEGNQVFWDDSRRAEMASVGPNSRWYWSDRPKRYYNARELDQAQLVAEVKAASCGSDIVLVIHPEYYGARPSRHSQPPFTVDRPRRVVDGPLAPSWEPDSLVAVDPDSAIHMANEWGMLDVPVPAVRPDGCLRVLCVGGENLDAATVPIGSHVTRRLEFLLAEMYDRPVQVTKLAHPGADARQRSAWLDHGIATLEPDVVVLGVPGSPTGDELDAVERMVNACIASERVVVLLVESTDSEPGGGTPGWNELASGADVLIVDPAAAIRRESSDLGIDDPVVWSPTGHRIAAVALASAIGLLQRRKAGSQWQSNHEALLASSQAAALRPLGPTFTTDLDPPTEADDKALGLLSWPVPFDGALAFADDYQAPTVESVVAQRSQLVEHWGLDHGIGLPLADHHQRYSRGRRGLSTPNAALLTHDLRSDNAPLGGGASWLAQGLAWYHRGDLDHLAGLSAWGARSLALDVEPGPDGGSRLISPAGTSTSNDVPYMFNADHFPIGTLAIETASATAPPFVQVVGGGFVARADGRRKSQVVEPVGQLELAHVRPLLGGTQLLCYRPIPDGEPIAPNDREAPQSQRTTLDHGALDGFDVSIAPLQVLGAGLHNIDVDAVAAALERLASHYGVRWSLLVAPRHHGFYTAAGLLSSSKRLERARRRHPDGAPTAGFGDVGGAAHISIADSATTAAFSVDSLRDNGLRTVAANGGLFETADRVNDDQVGDWPADRPSQVVAHGADRSGQALVYAQPLDPWLDQRAEDLAAGHYGWNATDPGIRRLWFTRPSVLTNFAALHRLAATHTTRTGDEIAVAGIEAPFAIDHKDQLFGLSFQVQDPAKASVQLESNPVAELIRWADHDAVTVGACGVRWPVIADVDPIVVANNGGDLARSDIAGSWTWIDAGDSDSHGRLAIGDAGTGRLTLEFGKLNTAGAQVLHFRSRAIGEPSAFSVRLTFEGGATVDVTTQGAGAGADMATPSCGRWQLPMPASTWQYHTVPLWGLDWNTPPTPALGITAVEISCTGSAGSGVDIGELWLGRPRQLPASEQPEPMLGGNALGRTRVRGQHVRTGSTFDALVDTDGLWHSGPIAPGAWLLRAFGDKDGDEHEGAPITVQLATPRFDIDLAPTAAG